MHRTIIITAAMLLHGCASLPDVGYQYFGAQASTSVRLVRTIACDRTGKIIEVHAPLVTTSYSADPLKKQTLDLTGLRSAFSDSDVKLEWYDDGRLKSVNQASTGQGEAILKAAIGIAAAAAGAPVGGAGPTALVRTAECKLVDTLGRGKPISLSYRPDPLGADGKPAALGYEPGLPRVLVPKDDYDRHVHEQLKDVLQVLHVKVESAHADQNLASSDEPGILDGRQPSIRLYGTTTVTYAFQAEVMKGTTVAIEVFARDTAIVPNGIVYALPVPRPALFGKQSFALTLAESGRISSSGYTSTSGAASVLGVAAAAQGATRGKSAAERAALDEAEADLIAQQQRLLRCRATPETCS